MDRRSFLKRLSLAVSSIYLSSAAFSTGCGKGIPFLGNKTMFDRVIVLGVDGISPILVNRYMAEGDLPALKRIAEAGTFGELATSNPAQSPVAWSNIGTGCDSGEHGIFDFIVRDPGRYLPELGVLKNNAQNVLGIREKMFLPTCRAKFFWDYTAEEGIPSTSIRWPMTFPPASTNGTVLAGLGVPDIKGGLGRYAFYSTKPQGSFSEGAEKVITLSFSGGVARTDVIGPTVQGILGRKDATIPLEVKRVSDGALRLSLAGKSFEIGKGRWSDWVTMEFSAGPMKKVSGIGRFYVVETAPDVSIYLTPLQVNPADPCFVISNPDDYTKKIVDALGGPFYTVGIPEDTKPLTEGMIDDDAFISQCDQIMGERRKMLSYGLNEFKDGVFSCVIDTTDRIQHIFWRLEDEGHPLFNTADKARYGNIIRDYYKRVDQVAGEIMADHVDDRTLLLICSDHGFTSFRKSVHINRWLINNGFMVLKSEPDPADQEGGALFKHVDWSKTAAYCLGFSSLYLNKKGREGTGILEEGQAEGVKKKIVEGLGSFADPDTGEKVVRSAYAASDLYTGAYLNDAPDVIIGFAPNYRISWQTAIGGTPKGLVELNLKKWSGDHIVDPDVVPGVIFSNAKLNGDRFVDFDVCPTVLSACGITGKTPMRGKSLL
jgi:predicted AlkP superfamily phosphohydrolase/phosphomutase